MKKKNNILQVFEYDYLPIGDGVFRKEHWKALGLFNQTHGDGFFTLRPLGVKFSQFVGVIQVGDLTIEILPKVGRNAPEHEKGKWQRVLIEMLNECRWMKLFANEKAQLRHKHNNILDAYLEIFINECEGLLRGGLIKKYRPQESNQTALKGKLLFSKQVRHNFIHQERFFTRYQVYDRNNPYNRILYKALRLLPKLTQSPLLKDRVNALLLGFPELDDIKVDLVFFERLVFGRKEIHYKPAIEIAAMLLLNYRPDISSGRNNILALLFDMNDLWEEYLFRKMIQGKPAGWEINPQRKRIFWKNEKKGLAKRIRPDMIISIPSFNRVVIIDTKWKIPEGSVPDDADLKQIFVYNEYWKGRTGILLYPSRIYSEKLEYNEGYYTKRTSGKVSHDEYTSPNQVSKEEDISTCGLLSISVLNRTGSGLDHNIGQRICTFLQEELQA